MATTTLAPWRIEKVGIECIDHRRSIMRCRECQATWIAPLSWRNAYRFQRDWWRCPKSCNAHYRNISRPHERRVVLRPIYHLRRLFRRFLAAS
jgi:hypothetical protein